MLKPDYKELLKQIDALLLGENDLIANLSNIAALLHEAFKSHWTGFYLVKNNQLVLGPFQGPVACTRISYGKGVCGTSWETKLPIIVDDVHEFKGHIACSPLSNSEIVIPILMNNSVKAVLDIDSTEFGAFNNADLDFFMKVCELLSDFFNPNPSEVN